MNYWLMKSEPEECLMDDALAAPGATVPWAGVRNYQARNFMKGAMRVGDGVLFYHSSCDQPGIVGMARVASKRDVPRWLLVNAQVLRKGNRLSITPVEPQHWRTLSKLIDEPKS